MSDANPMAAEVLEISATGFASAADAHLQRTRPDVARGGSTGWRAYFRQRVLELAAAVRVGDPACSCGASSGCAARPGAHRRRLAVGLALQQPRRRAAARSAGRLAWQHRRRARRGARAACATRSRPSRRARADDAAGRLALEYLYACLDGDAAGGARALLAAARRRHDAARHLLPRLMPAQRRSAGSGIAATSTLPRSGSSARRRAASWRSSAARYEPRSEDGARRCSRQRSPATRTISACAPQPTCSRSRAGVVSISAPTFRAGHRAHGRNAQHRARVAGRDARNATRRDGRRDRGDQTQHALVHNARSAASSSTTTAAVLRPNRRRRLLPAACTTSSRWRAIAARRDVASLDPRRPRCELGCFTLAGIGSMSVRLASNTAAAARS